HAVLLQGLLQNPADGAVVIDDPDIGGLAHSSSPGSGRNRVKVVWPGTLSHSMRPWCRVTMFWVIDSPRPVPSARPLTMGYKMLSRMPGAMPEPMSVIDRRQTRP